MGCLLFFLFLRLMRGHPCCFILDLLQLFPIDRRFHRVLNRNPPIRNAWQCVGNNLARPVSDAVSFRQFTLDFFEFGKKGFALRFKPCMFRFQRRTLLLIERRRKPQRLHEFFAQPDCFLQAVQFVAVFDLELFALAAPVDAFVFLLNWLQFSDGLNRAKQRVNITDSAFFCRRFRFDFGKYPLSFGNVLSKPTDRVKLVIREMCKEVLEDWDPKTITYENRTEVSGVYQDYCRVLKNQYSWKEFDVTSLAGLESYLTYDHQSAGLAGTGSVSLVNGSLIFAHADTAMNGNRLPVSVTHYYNSCDSNEDEFGMGYGWRTSLHQTLYKVRSAMKLR